MTCLHRAALPESRWSVGMGIALRTSFMMYGAKLWSACSSLPLLPQPARWRGRDSSPSQFAGGESHLSGKRIQSGAMTKIPQASLRDRKMTEVPASELAG
jgi:hypothetical protein